MKVGEVIRVGELIDRPGHVGKLEMKILLQSEFYILK